MTPKRSYFHSIAGLALLTLVVTTGCASPAALGMPTAVASNADPPPMCVALRGSFAAGVGTTEVTSAIAAGGARDTGASNAKKTTARTTVKDRRPLVFAKGT
jgi:hypothetical protein